MKKIHILLGVALTLSSVNVGAQVYINGQLFQGAALYQLQQQYGEAIPSGNYWLMQNGNWGYVGSSQVQGNFHMDNQAETASQGSGYTDIYPGSGSVVKDGRSGCTYYDLGGYSYNTCDGL
jgi:hypothetical protein